MGGVDSSVLCFLVTLLYKIAVQTFSEERRAFKILERESTIILFSVSEFMLDDRSHRHTLAVLSFFSKSAVGLFLRRMLVSIRTVGSQ